MYTRAYKEVRSVSFSEKFAYVLSEWSSSLSEFKLGMNNLQWIPANIFSSVTFFGREKKGEVVANWIL